MVHIVERATQAARQRLSSVLVAPAPQAVDEAWRRFSRRWPVTDLATPPEGSDLRPVRGDYGTPIVGHLLDYIRFGTEFGRERYDCYGPVSWMGAFGTRMAMVTGPEATQRVLTNADKAFSQGGWRFLIDRFFHRGLMLLDFDEHKMHRRIMQHAFTRDRLDGYTHQVSPCVRATVPTWPTQRPVRLYWLLKRLTLTIATQVFMGGRGTDTERINQAFVATVRAASALVRAPLPGTRWRAGVRGRRVLEDYFAQHLPAARASTGEDLFAALCQATTPEGEQFSDDEVINHMIFLMMAAHDTATITITTTAAAAYLATHPEWQERARQESLALGDDPLDMDALESLDTLDRIVKEALPLLAPVPLVMRKTVTDTDVLGHYLPADTLVAVAPAINHFVPECWTEPDTFDPDRFAPHRREDQNHRFAWIPFGGGVHKCIGLHFGTLELKAILHEMLRTYQWAVPGSYRARWDNTSLPVPADGLPVYLTHR